MIRKLKFLGATAVAVIAMSSAVASVASADVLTSEKGGTTTLTGKQGATADIFNTHAGQFKCTSVTYTGSFTTGAASVTVTPSFAGCTAAGLASTIDMNGCTYLITLDVTKSTEAAMDIVCPAGQEITITAPSVGTKKCVTHIPPQQDLTEITGTNIGSGTTREVTLDINIKNIKYNQTAGTAETGNCATADNTTGGTYTGDAIITGSSGGVHVGIFLS